MCVTSGSRRLSLLLGGGGGGEAGDRRLRGRGGRDGRWRCAGERGRVANPTSFLLIVNSLRLLLLNTGRNVAVW